MQIVKQAAYKSVPLTRILATVVNVITHWMGLQDFCMISTLMGATTLLGVNNTFVLDPYMCSYISLEAIVIFVKSLNQTLGELAKKASFSS